MVCGEVQNGLRDQEQWRIFFLDGIRNQEVNLFQRLTRLPVTITVKVGVPLLKECLCLVPRPDLLTAILPAA